MFGFDCRDRGNVCPHGEPDHRACLRCFDSVLAERDHLKRELESAKPEWDATDGAHPCWWRGHDNGAKGMKAKLEKQHAAEISELTARYEADLALARTP